VYRVAYSKLYRRLQNQSLNLGFVLVDHPYEYLFKGSSLAALMDLVNYTHARGVPTGLLVTSAIRDPVIDPRTGEDISMQTFSQNSYRFLQSALEQHIPFDFYLQTSFYRPIHLDRPQLELVESFADLLDARK
jgi:hypothetical protein